MKKEKKLYSDLFKPLQKSNFDPLVHREYLNSSPIIPFFKNKFNLSSCFDWCKTT
jgi:hypothetical protein